MQKPDKIHLHKKSNSLELQFGDKQWQLSAEFLRVHSPSAEVKGHGPGQEKLVDEKRKVAIESIRYAGNYGLHIAFDDGHNSGIYTWHYLQQMGSQQQTLWQQYLDRLNAAQKSRDPHTSVVQFSP
ncbi:MAG: DUF971 family protein [Cellvibrionaceae bacterium]|jgi:DUF971 family protein